MSFIAGKAENLGLVWSDQQIDDLHLFRLARLIFLEIGACRKNLNVLQECPYLRSVKRIASGWKPCNQDIHAHSGYDESRDANYLVHSDRACPHSGRDHRSQTA